MPNSQELVLADHQVPQPRITIASLIAKLLYHGPARDDTEIHAYINSHFDWDAVATPAELIRQAQWAHIENALHSTTTLLVKTDDGQDKKKRVRKYLKPTEYDADGNAAKRWKPATHCTEKQLKECGAQYVKQTLDLAEATNAFGVHAKKIVNQRRALQQSGQTALPVSLSRTKQGKKVMTPPTQSFFTEFMEVATVNPDTGERHLRVKAEEVKISDTFAEESPHDNKE